MIKGTTILIPFQVFLDEEETQVANLTSSTIYLIGKKRAEDLDANKLFEKSVGSGITITDAINGKAQAEIAPADTNGLTIDQIYIEIIVKLSNGRVIRDGENKLPLSRNVRKTLP